MLIDSKGSANVVNMYNINSMYVVNFECKAISEESQYLMIIDTLTNKKYYFDSESYTDDLLFYDYMVLPFFLDFYKDCFIGVLYPDLWKQTFNSIADSRKNSANYKKALGYYQALADNQNPLIICYYFKSNL